MATNAKNIAELLNTDTTVKVGDIEDGSVTTAKLAADAVTAAKLADNSVVTANIVDGNVTAVKTSADVGKGKNILINGDMHLAQRGTSLAMAHDGLTSPYLIDRWRVILGGTHEQLDGTYAQVADHPTSVNGKSLKWTTGTAESSYDAEEYAYVTQIVEAQNVQHLNYGNSNAQTITVSFYVKSSITGTYAVGLYKPDSTARIFNKTYTISSANTWEKKTLTFVGDTDSGAAIVNDTGQGIWISWHLATGSNYTGGGSTSGWVTYGNNKWADGQTANVMTTAGATWQLAQCQAEVGATATDFETLSIGEQLNLCRRYYQINYTSWYGVAAATGYFVSDSISYVPPMRANPSVAQTSFSSGSGGRFTVTGATSSTINGTNIYSSPTSAGGNSGYTATWSADAEI